MFRERFQALAVPPVVHRRLEDVDELLVAGELGRDDGEDVPVVLLHDVQHQQRLLLDGGSELEERRLHILRGKGVVEGEGGGGRRTREGMGNKGRGREEICFGFVSPTTSISWYTVPLKYQSVRGH